MAEATGVSTAEGVSPASALYETCVKLFTENVDLHRRVSATECAIRRNIRVIPAKRGEDAPVTLIEEVKRVPSKSIIDAWRICSGTECLFVDTIGLYEDDIAVTDFEGCKVLNEKCKKILDAWHKRGKDDATSREIVLAVSTNLQAINKGFKSLAQLIDGPVSMLEESKAVLADLSARLESHGVHLLMGDMSAPAPPAALYDIGIDASMWKIVNEWVSEAVGADMAEPAVVYVRSKDGDKPSDFHRCVDGIPRLVVIIREATSGWLFGGFTSVGFQSTGGWKSDPQAFVFTLTNPHGIAPTKYKSSGDAYGVLSDANYAFWFGHSGNVGLCGVEDTYALLGTHGSYVDSTFLGARTFTGVGRGWAIADVVAFKV